MPNWCYNTLTLTHTDPTMIQRAVDGYNRGALFHEFVPCPDNEDWYSFNNANWGTKWDVGDSGFTVEAGATTVTMTFDTAWSPPVAFYQVLDQLGFFVDAYYYEPGMSFCGHYTTDGGDEYYEITGDSDWVEENIPSDMNEVFSISESMAEWEDLDADEEENLEIDLDGGVSATNEGVHPEEDSPTK